jgi:hypothetical protein
MRKLFPDICAFPSISGLKKYLKILLTAFVQKPSFALNNFWETYPEDHISDYNLLEDVSVFWVMELMLWLHSWNQLMLMVCPLSGV